MGALSNGLEDPATTRQPRTAWRAKLSTTYGQNLEWEMEYIHKSYGESTT
jgi:hypothetical protein